MSPRTGRPKVENAKTEKMSICLNQTSKQKLEEYCKRENVSRSEAIRRGIDLLTEKE
ncbi:MAG: ribbon-helix-helix protein, CopG family [Christensenellales bacterium]|jgi:metal-responsive CopG/Arc/MetJ family transcriptional regulator